MFSVLPWQTVPLKIKPSLHVHWKLPTEFEHEEFAGQKVPKQHSSSSWEKQMETL